MNDKRIYYHLLEYLKFNSQFIVYSQFVLNPQFTVNPSSILKSVSNLNSQFIVNSQCIVNPQFILNSQFIILYCDYKAMQLVCWETDMNKRNPLNNDIKSNVIVSDIPPNASNRASSNVFVSNDTTNFFGFSPSQYSSSNDPLSHSCTPLQKFHIQSKT